MRAYLRMTSGIDTAIARFLSTLEAAGLADHTIIVYSADNGCHSGTTTSIGSTANWNSDTSPFAGAALTFPGNVQNITSNNLVAVDPIKPPAA